ncbi:hypothetical protein PILCRDRAFT_830143, partial [Piloderma croceum F 1598]
RRKPTDLNLQTIVEYLICYERGDFHINGQPPLSKKGQKKGELFNLRSLLRQRYPSEQVTILTIRDALDSRPEWRTWMHHLMNERKQLSFERHRTKRLSQPYAVQEEHAPNHDDDIVAFLE